MARHSGRAWVVLGVVMVTGVGGCAQVLGIDDDYHVVTTGGGGAGGLSTGGVGGTGGSMSASGGSSGVGGAGGGGECASGQKQCAGNTPQTCDLSGTWLNSTPCTGQTPVCSAGACITPPSCNGLGATCGPANDESCCAVTVVPGDTYDRSNDLLYPATISDFRLDRFEITVGRFREFVKVYPASKPEDGAGQHPLIGGSGWNAGAWGAALPPDRATLEAVVKCDPTYQTWTDEPGANENLPMNCITWWDAFAFCVWDGGRLPTEAEWNYAAAGGEEQRVYPWGGATADAEHAVYDCTGNGSPAGSCAFTDILNVGAKSPVGDGKWGQAELTGNMSEWNLDSSGDYPVPCINCANLLDLPYRVIRGGGWDNQAAHVSSSYRANWDMSGRQRNIGARCARIP